MIKKLHERNRKFYWFLSINENIADELLKRLIQESIYWKPFILYANSSGEITYYWKPRIPPRNFDWLIKNGYAFKTKKNLLIYEFTTL